MSEPKTLLELRGVSKTFDGSPALQDVALSIRASEVHGLLGENGSGKSTLIKILSGFHVPDSGELFVDGGPLSLPLRGDDGRRLGLEFVHQDLGLVAGLSVTENLLLECIAHPDRKSFISQRNLERQARDILGRFNLRVDPRIPVDELRPVERAMIAIVRAVVGLERYHSSGAKVLVLDEPTVFLPQLEVEILFKLLRSIVRADDTAVLFVSHDLNEVLRITDEVTVLRDGRVSGTRRTSECSPAQLIELIVGHDLDDSVRDRTARPESDVSLQVRGLVTATVDNVSFDLKEGEILGVTGLVGSGYEGVVYGLFGAEPASAGKLSMNGSSVNLSSMTPDRAVEMGMAFVPGDRLGQGSIASLSAEENINLLTMEENRSWFGMSIGKLKTNAAACMTVFNVRPVDPTLDFGTFSGGNQQKMLLGKWHQKQPKVMLMHEPTQGVDVGARSQIWQLISKRECAYVCASSDYEQLAAICDRVMIVSQGRVIGELAGEAVTRERLSNSCLRGSVDDSSGPVDGSARMEPSLPTVESEAGDGKY